MLGRVVILNISVVMNFKDIVYIIFFFNVNVI